MGKPKKIHRQPRFQYDRNRSREWKNSKKLPAIECKQIKKAWNSKKSIQQNMRLMGLSMDPNITLKIPTTKELLTGESSKETKKKKPNIQTNVVAELEEEANTPLAKTLQLSEPEVRYCVHMIEKYGEDYKAMAKDRRNYYQDTPKQIKRKITSFKSTPSQYSAYLKLKDVVHRNDNECTPEKIVVDIAVRNRKVTRQYIARRRNGHYTSPSDHVKTGNPCGVEVPLCRVKRKLYFGRKPPTPRDAAADSPCRKREKFLQKKQTAATIHVKEQRQKLSKELCDLLEMADHFVYSDKFRSKKQKVTHGAYKQHSPPELTNLMQVRQN